MKYIYFNFYNCNDNFHEGNNKTAIKYTIIPMAWNNDCYMFNISKLSLHLTTIFDHKNNSSTF